MGKNLRTRGEISCAEEVIDVSQVSVHVELINKENVRVLRNQEEEGVGIDNAYVLLIGMRKDCPDADIIKN